MKPDIHDKDSHIGEFGTLLVYIALALPIVGVWYIVLAFTGLLGVSLAGPVCMHFASWLVGVILFHEALLVLPVRALMTRMGKRGVSAWLGSHLPGLVALSVLIYWVFVLPGCPL